MDLLSPAETHAFQSFLAAIDVDHVVASEWAFLADDLPVPHAPPGRQALEKATRDLMALQPPPSLAPSAWSLPHPNSPQRVPRTPAVATPLQQQHQRACSSSMSPALIRPRDPSPSSSAVSPTPVDPSPSRSAKRSHSQDSDIPKPPSKRSRPSLTSRAPHKNAAPAPASASASGPAKPTLLTASQKKANHIQSEQKRRANIRRGYEALCDTIPALREAIRAEEASAAAACTKKRKARAKATEDPEKTDGRAGPRSENIVLQKTIDYIHDLHGQREGLLRRLQQARGALARGHPALVPGLPGQPLWEREWTGGTGRDDESDDDD